MAETGDAEGVGADSAALHSAPGFDSFWPQCRFTALELRNFLSFRDATLELSDFVALVGPNSSGKSNAVAAIRLLREISVYGLPTAIARRGGFDQMRHRSSGRPNDPSLRLRFAIAGGARESSYLLSFGAVKGGQYRVKRESAELFYPGGRAWSFDRDGDSVRVGGADPLSPNRKEYPATPGQSVLPVAGPAAMAVFGILQQLQTVEVNPAKVGELQEPSSTHTFESDGSNVASLFEALDRKTRDDVVGRLAAVVPGIVGIEVAHFADKVTLRFRQKSEDGTTRTFLAKQMSDGTLRAFAILVAMFQQRRPALLAIEEPEVAIHLGALSSLVQILEAETDSTQIVITTHSADIVDSLPLDSLRVVWNEGGVSRIAKLAEHSKAPVKQGLITPGQLLRSDALDPQSA